MVGTGKILPFKTACNKLFAHEDVVNAQSNPWAQPVWQISPQP